MSACRKLEFIDIFIWSSFESLEQAVAKREHINVTGARGETPLHNAVLNRDGRRVVKFVLSKGVDINARDDNLQTPLHYACERRKLNVAKVLIESGADVFAVDEDGENALHFALHETDNIYEEKLRADGHTHWDLIQLLIDHGLDINSKDYSGVTPIFIAARSGDTDILQKLTDHGADINVISKEKLSPIYYSACFNQGETLQWLLKNGSLVDLSPRMLLLELCDTIVDSFYKEDASTAEVLIKYGARVGLPNNYQKSLLKKAAMCNAVDFIQVLLKYGADINAVDCCGNTALISTFEHGLSDGKEAFELLLSQGANVNCVSKANSTALTEAVKTRNWEAIEDLTRGGAKQTDVLFEACTSGIEFVKYFIERGEDPKSSGNRDTYPIHVAASSRELEVVRYLVDLGCDVDSRDALQETPLHRAVSTYCTEEICEYLLENGADVNATNVDKRTPLFNAYDLSKLKILLKHGAAVNVRDINGNTPFHIFCRDKLSEWVETLVEAGADMHALNDKREGGLHMAAYSGNLENVEYMLKLGLNINDESDERGAPLYYATSSAVLAFFVEKGCDINALNHKGETYFYYNNPHCFDIEEMDELLKIGADLNLPTTDGVTPLHRACQVKSEDQQKGTVQRLLDRGADKEAVDKKGRNILHHACQNSDLKFVKKVLKLDVPFDSTDYENKNVLHYAAENGDIELVRYIYGRIPSLNCPDNNGHPPFYYCTSRGVGDFLMPRTYNIQPKDMNQLLLDGSSEDDPFPVLRKLINMGASVNTTDDLGNTPLHYAALSGSCKAIRLLLDAGASINALNQELQSPVYSAMISNNLDAVKLLVTSGADITLIDRRNCSPQQFAWQNSPKIAKYLSSKVTA